MMPRCHSSRRPVEGNLRPRPSRDQCRDHDAHALQPQPGSPASRYRMIRSLGKGAMGEVSLMEDSKLDRKVAIKMMRPDVRRSSRDAIEMRHRFVREAKTAGKLAHPNIVTIYDSFEGEDGVAYIVMEYVEGRTLTSFIEGGSSIRPSDQALHHQRFGGTAIRSREWRLPSRHQARQHHDLAEDRRREGHGLWHSPRGRVGDDGRRQRPRNAELHVAGADERREGRRAQRRLFAWRGPLRAARRHAPLYGGEPVRDHDGESSKTIRQLPRPSIPRGK